jgi:hypothetical protein
VRRRGFSEYYHQIDKMRREFEWIDRNTMGARPAVQAHDWDEAGADRDHRRLTADDAVRKGDVAAAEVIVHVAPTNDRDAGCKCGAAGGPRSAETSDGLVVAGR